MDRIVKQDYQQMLGEYVGILWRQKLWILIPTVGGILVSIALIFYLPKVYRSTTLILVEAQKVPEEYVKSAVTGSVEDRLSTIKQQILSRTLLTKIIDRYGLYKEGSQQMVTEEIIEMMRKKIEVKTVGRGNVEAFSLSFEGTSPVTVMEVTNQLASLFIEENLKIREQLIEGTSEFLDNELNSLKQTLERQESEIGEFKRIHMGELPGQLEANLRSLDRFQSDLASIQLAKKSAQDRKMALESSIEVARGRMEEVVRLNEEMNLIAGESNIPSASPKSPLASPLMQKLIQKKKELASLSLEYKESYPDIIALKREIHQLEDQVAQTEMSGMTVPPPPEAVENKTEGVRIRRNGTNEEGTPGKTLPAEEWDTSFMADLHKQIRSVNLEMDALRERESNLRKQIQIFEKRVEDTPAREQELATLLRDYESTRKNYAGLLDKKLNAKISENLEKKQKGEQFRILDPANLPEKPFKPDRLKIGLAGLVLGLGGGIALAFVREQLDSAIRKPEEVERIISVPVLVSIPDFAEEMRIPEREVKSKVGVNEQFGEKTDHV